MSKSNTTVETRESPQQAAVRWGVSVDTIRRLIASGKVPAYRLNKRIIRLDPADVDAAFRPIPHARMGGVR